MTPEQQKRRDWNLRKRYGIDSTHYDSLLKMQDGACAICETVTNKLVVDHCHNSNKVRGLLCNGCNCALGYVKENINILVSMANYLLYGYGHRDDKI